MRKTARYTALAASGLLALSSLTACANDAASTASTSKGDGKGEKVKIMVGGLDKVIYLPAMLTQRLGYFDAEGLDVELLSEPAGVQAETALVSGQVQGAVGFYDHTLDLQVKGKDVESVVQFSHAPGEVEIVSSKAAGDITSPRTSRARSSASRASAPRPTSSPSTSPSRTA